MSLTTKTKVVIGFVIAVFISVMACFLSYNSLKQVSLVVDDLSEENLRLTSIKKLLRTIDLAEAEINNYALNKKKSKLDTINAILFSMSAEVRNLKKVSQTNTEQTLIVNTIDSLTNKQINWYYNFIGFKSKGVSDAFFNSIYKSLDSLYKANKKTTPQEIKEKQKFFSKLLKRTKKEKQVANNELYLENSITQKKINQIIDEAQYTHLLNQRNSTDKELTLLHENKEIKGKLYSQINVFEANEILIAKQKAATSKEEAKIAITILSIIVFLGILSFIFFSLVIINDITKGNKLKLALIASRREAIRLARAKEEFVANMSHEIRTPLNSIIGFAEQLDDAKNEEEKHKHAAAIQKSSKHLLTLVNDILDFSKISIGKITLEKIPFSIKEIIDDMAEIFTPLATKKGLQLHTTFDNEISNLVLEGDSHRIKQILLNLISNAVKFTEQGAIEIIITHLSLDGKKIELQVTVKDTGIGIHENSLKKIFNSFDQADNSITRKFGGTGLGLSICKQLAEIQGGEITVSSRLGIGSEFTFKVPLNTIAKIIIDETKLENQNIDIKKLSGKKILVVDDDEMSVLLLTTILEKHDISYIVASNGKEGFSKYLSDDFDVILTDVNMPEMSGVDLLKQIRKNSRKEINIPVIAVTANVNKNDVKKYLENGFNDVLLKPYLEEDLLQLILKVFTDELSDNKTRSNENYLPDLIGGSFSIEQLKRISGDSADFVLKMLGKFIISANECSDNMAIALSDKNWEKLAAVAHKSIPSYAMMDINDIVEQLRLIEKSIKNNEDKNPIEEVVTNIIHKNKKIVSDIKNYIEQVEQGNTAN